MDNLCVCRFCWPNRYFTSREEFLRHVRDDELVATDFLWDYLLLNHRRVVLDGLPANPEAERLFANIVRAAHHLVNRWTSGHATSIEEMLNNEFRD